MNKLDEYCQKGSQIFDENGLIVGTPLSHEYYKIYCILMNKRQISWIYYPFLFFSSTKQLMEIMKIGIMAEKQGLKYLDLNIIMPDNEKFVIVYKDPKNETNAYLLGYLDSLNKVPKNFMERLTYTWLRQDLMHIPKKQSRGLLLFLYYRGFSTPMKKAYKGAPSPQLVDELKQKYQFVKEYDNFADFNAKLKKAQEEGTKMKKKMLTEKGFATFRKNTPVRDFVFPMDQAMKTGAVTPDMLQEINAFKKTIKNTK